VEVLLNADGKVPPGPNTDPVLVGRPFDAGSKTEAVGLAAGVVLEALPPGPKTDPVGFGFENTEPPKAEAVAGCCAPNAEGCPNADVVVLCTEVPKADVAAAGVLPKDD